MSKLRFELFTLMVVAMFFSVACSKKVAKAVPPPPRVARVPARPPGRPLVRAFAAAWPGSGHSGEPQ